MIVPMLTGGLDSRPPRSAAFASTRCRVGPTSMVPFVASLLKDQDCWPFVALSFMRRDGIAIVEGMSGQYAIDAGRFFFPELVAIYWQAERGPS